jgi:peptidyl-prolyl cis-trans isomerase B (cyclophilin B)
MLTLVAAVALAADPVPTVLELEWARATPTEIGTYARSDNATVRVAVARALGRIRSEKSLPILQAMTADSHPDVEVAVAEALGYTVGSAHVLRDWLELTPVPRGFAQRAAADEGLRVQLLRALGRQGGPDDVRVLIAALAEPWPTGAAAAEGLGVMGRREVDGVHAAVTPLARALTASRHRVVPMAAFALARIGMEGAGEADLTIVAEIAENSPDPLVRARLVRAIWPGLPGFAREHVLTVALLDGSPLVRISALDRLQEGQVTASAVISALTDGDAGVRSAAMRAAARLGSVDALKALELVDPWEEATRQAALVAADRAPNLGLLDDESVAAVVRAALVGAVGTDSLIAFAVSDEPDAVRTAAAEALLAAQAEPDVALQLLDSRDVVVREVAMGLLVDADAGAINDLVTHLRVEPDTELLGVGLEVVLVFVEKNGRKPLQASDKTFQGLIARGSEAPSWRTRRVSSALGNAFGLDVPERAGAHPIEVILPNGAHLEGSSEAVHVLTHARGIRSARVHTERGEFRIDLFPEVAPLAVSNFATLSYKDFYDDVVFHRVAPGFVVQTGCPRGDGSGGPGYSIPDEVSSLPYREGAVGMARSDRDTGGSQWFVMLAEHPHLVGDYTLFGQVSYGMEVVKRIERGDRILDVEIE